MGEKFLSKKKIKNSIKLSFWGEGLIIIGAILMFVKADMPYKIASVGIIVVGIVLAIIGNVLFRTCRCPYCGIGHENKSKDREFRQALYKAPGEDIMCPECRKIIKIK